MCLNNKENEHDDIFTTIRTGFCADEKLEDIISIDGIPYFYTLFSNLNFLSW